jgi:protein-S-isoprenylcysteine O-methyltransferase Ste14
LTLREGLTYAKSLLRPYIANVALAGWLLADAVRVVIFAHDLRSNWVDLITVPLFVITAGFVLSRPPSLAQDTSLGAVGVAVMATIFPVTFAWLVPDQSATGFLLIVQGAAVTLLGASLLCLGRNFSIIAQYRSVTTYGPYALVRHPIYGSYLIFDGALVLEHQSLFAGILWLAEGVLLLARALYEERLLAASDPAYARYLTCVRWRFVPAIA